MNRKEQPKSACFDEIVSQISKRISAYPRFRKTVQSVYHVSIHPVRVALTGNMRRVRQSRREVEKYHNIHNAERCFIIGNGPSLCAEDLNLLLGEKCFGVNKIYTNVYFALLIRLLVDICLFFAVLFIIKRKNQHRIKT